MPRCLPALAGSGSAQMQLVTVKDLQSEHAPIASLCPASSWRILATVRAKITSQREDRLQIWLLDQYADFSHVICTTSQEKGADHYYILPRGLRVHTDMTAVLCMAMVILTGFFCTSVLAIQRGHRVQAPSYRQWLCCSFELGMVVRPA